VVGLSLALIGAIVRPVHPLPPAFPGTLFVCGERIEYKRAPTGTSCRKSFLRVRVLGEDQNRL